MKTIRSFAMLLGFVALAGCDKNAVQIDSITEPTTGARVKFFNFGINAPPVNFYNGTTKVTAISSTTTAEATTGVAYGAVAAGNLYVDLPAGAASFSGRISATVDKDLPISTIAGTLEAGKAYSVYLSGFYNTTTKQVEGFVVEDAFPTAFDYTSALVRFVNASPNSQPMQLSARSSTATADVTVGASVAYKAGGAFVALPAGAYDLFARTAGATTNAISRTGVSFIAGRVYTITARGDMTVTSTTATNRPFLDNSVNR
ncbi:DUF4397 domain-containing protein [Gemmatimonas phototrophica]|uniref:DUF4397 domain-containing protein n=1 Tax=Gemmatimonas phototrophica TaxID=1379270 RepID=UPI0006A6F7EC|nr:DUF4397 domain-containing protein [Gemmatimonas phototrophica]